MMRAIRKFEKCPECGKKGAYQYRVTCDSYQKPRVWYAVWVCRYCNYYEKKQKQKRIEA